MSRHDVAVVGLGAFGSAAAYHLTKRGLDVVGLDAFDPPHTRGSSHGETRIIREAFFEHPSYVHLVRRAFELWAALEGEAGVQLYQRTGGLFVGPSDGELVTGVRQALVEHDIPHEELAPEALARRYPAFNPAPGMEALVERRAGVLFVERCLRAHLGAAEATGARLQTNTPVTGWRADRTGVRLSTRQGVVEADHLVVAGGPWMPQLLAEAELPLTATRQVLFWFQPTHERRSFEAPRFPIFGVEHEPGNLLYGLPDVGTGVKVGFHALGEATTPDTADRGVHEAEVDEMRAVLRAHVPTLDGALRRDVVCLYTATPDRHFVLDHHPDHDNVVLLGGGSGHGFKFSAAIGEIAADLVGGDRPRVSIDLFQADRFG